MEKSCARERCRCVIAHNSPSAFCCEACERAAGAAGHCTCGHEACGGIAEIIGAEGPDTLV
jgi:hypothetical protein